MHWRFRLSFAGSAAGREVPKFQTAVEKSAAVFSSYDLLRPQEFNHVGMLLRLPVTAAWLQRIPTKPAVYVAGY